MAKIIMIASGKGGTGKSTVCAGLSVALALRGRQVIAVDADFGMRNLDIYLGLYEKTIFDSGDVASGRKELSDVLTAHDRISGLKLLASPAKENPALLLHFAEIIREASLHCDYCLIDCPAGVGAVFSEAAKCSDSVILVTTPDLACISDSSAAEDKLASLGASDISVVANRVRAGSIKKGYCYNLDELMDMVGVPTLGYVREDDEILRQRQDMSAYMLNAANRKIRYKAAFDIRGIAARLDGDEIPLKLI